MGRIKVEAFKCYRCGHIWLPRDMESKIDCLGKYQPKVCPKCKSSLKLDKEKDKERLICNECKLAYPIKDNIPVMLIEEAEKL